MAKDAEHLLKYLLAVCVSSFENHLFISLAYLFIDSFISSVLNSCSSMYIADISPLSGV